MGILRSADERKDTASSEHRSTSKKGKNGDMRRVRTGAVLNSGDDGVGYATASGNGKTSTALHNIATTADADFSKAAFVRRQAPQLPQHCAAYISQPQRRQT
jgi:hypothetical protein